MTTSDQLNRFSIFRSWCWLLACLSLLAASQQLNHALQQVIATSENSTAIERQSRSTPRFVVDVNQAPAHELEALPNVGTTLATRIVEYRKTQGPFRELDDLLQVYGVGERTLQQLRPMLTVRVVDEVTSP
ncbi:MAG: helix-hairpin-helix domain-containing protein [Planctomycetales bacterium]|nr:helix-hairpin-helix domain-containing protein [Planctomycetales bacterium]